MSFDSVLKIGGSLSRGSGLPALCREISALAKRHSILVVPGGGDFAEQVRKSDRRFHLDPTASHRMALLATDQYGYLLNQLIVGSFLTPDLDLACKSAESGRAAVFLPSAIVIKENPLPNSWQVTSDTIAAWIAHRAQSRRLILLKSVDGLRTSGGSLIREITAEQLSEYTGTVDEYLANWLPSVPLEAWVINGLCPERLSELLGTSQTTGTRIRPPEKQNATEAPDPN
jgi:hypothetical protein